MRVQFGLKYDVGKGPVNLKGDVLAVGPNDEGTRFVVLKKRLEDYQYGTGPRFCWPLSLTLTQ